MKGIDPELIQADNYSFSSVQFSRSVMSNSSQLHGLQQARNNRNGKLFLVYVKCPPFKPGTFFIFFYYFILKCWLFRDEKHRLFPK